MVDFMWIFLYSVFEGEDPRDRCFTGENRQKEKSMAILEWSDDLSVGIGAMDLQHKRLVTLLNSLHDAMKEGKAVVDSVLSQLVDYTKKHFAEEEKLMAANGFPALESHKKEHASLTAQLMDFQQQFSEGKVSLTQDLLQFLTQWLGGHIRGMDKSYGVYLNQKGLR